MLRRLLEIRAGEGRLVLLLGGHFFIFLAGTTILSVVAKGLFLDNYDAARLPYTYVGGSVATFLVTALYYRIRRLRPAPASVVSVAMLVGLLVALRLGAAFRDAEAVFALAIVAPAFGAVLGLEHVSLTRSQLDSRSARRLFPAIGTLGGIGASAAGFLVPLLSELVATPDLLWVAAALFAATLVPRLQVRIRRSRGPKLEPASWGRILRHRYALLLLALVFLSAVLPRLADYQLGAAAQELWPGDLSVFYGWLDGFLSGVSVVFTLFVSRFLIGRLGVGTSGLVYPLAVAAAALGGAVLPGLVTATGLFFSERLLRQNLQRPILGMAFMPLPPAIRSRIGLATSGVLRPLATLSASLAILALAPRLHWSTFAWGIGALALLILGCALVARRAYVRELFSALHSRRLRLEDEEIDAPEVLDAKIRQLLHDQLGSEYAEQVTLALQLLRGRCDAETVAIVERQWREWEPWVRAEAVEALGTEPVPAALELLRRLDESEPDEVRAAVLRTPALEPGEEELERLTREGPPAVRAEALRALAERRSAAAIGPVVEEWTASGDPQLHRAAARVIGAVDEPRLARHLPALARFAPAEVLAAVARHPAAELAEVCVAALADDRLYPEARRALLAIGAAGLPVLAEAARDRDRSAQALAVLGEIDDPSCRRELVGLLAEPDDELRFRAARALARRPEARIEGEEEATRAALGDELERCRRARAGSGESRPILRSEYSGDFQWALERTLMLLALLDPEDPYRRIYLSLVSDLQEDRSFAIEALDEMLEPEWKERLLPLLEEDEAGSPAGADEEADGWMGRLRAVLEGAADDPVLELAVRLKESSLFESWRVRDLEPLARVSWHAGLDEAPPSREAWVLIRDGEPVGLERTILSGESPEIEGEDDIVVPLARIYRTVARRPRCAAAWLRGLAERLAASTGPGEDVSRTTLMSLASRTIVRDRDQADDLDLWRRIFFLRSMELLSGLSSERLRLVAEIARPLSASPGEVILREGRLGNHFYLVCTGRAEVLAGGRQTAVLNPSDAFGALALLSGKGRTATVKALERCELLSIERVDFLDLTDAHPALARAFSRLIAQYALATAA